jgi:hypothetical protein
VVGTLIGSEFVAAQGAVDAIVADLFGALIGLPFYIVAYMILAAGFSETEHDASNWRCRALSFYDNTKVGKLLIFICLFAPAIGVYFSILFVTPDKAEWAFIWAMMPWGIACPFIPLDKLDVSRLQQKNTMKIQNQGL